MKPEKQNLLAFVALGAARIRPQVVPGYDRPLHRCVRREPVRRT
jgi:hypothetical protein